MWTKSRDHKLAGEALAAVRRRAGLTQQELAKRLKKPQSFVSAYEAGQRRIDLMEFMLIVEGLGADPKRTFADIVARRVRQT